MNPAKDRQDPRLTDEALMAAFARAWVRQPDTPTAHVMKLFPLTEDVGVAALAAYLWPRDPFVIDEKRRLLEAGNGALMPTKADAALLAYSIAEDEKASRSERLNALRLYSEMHGFIVKSPAAVQNFNTGLSPVMVVKDKGDEATWSRDLQEQQRNLQREARASADN